MSFTPTNTMLSTDITLNASTAIPAGTNSSVVFSLVGGATPERTVRANAATALTQPFELSIGHLKRRIKGFKTAANTSVPAPDVIIDRHTVRLDLVVSSLGNPIYDPDNKLRSVMQVTFEVPRLGAVTPTTTTISDMLKQIASMLTASSDANLIRILNHES